MQNAIAIVIADDHALLRESPAALLQSRPDFDVVGPAANGELNVGENTVKRHLRSVFRKTGTTV